MKPLVACVLFCMSCAVWATDYPAAQNPTVADGPGYVAVPNAEVPIRTDHVYKMVLESISAAEKPGDLVPAIARASMIVNALNVGHVPASNIKLVMVFHGPAVEGLLTNDAYHLKFGVDNPNLKAVKELANAGVTLFVCAQYMAGRKLGMSMLTPEVKLATAASLVLVTYQNDGYAVLSDR